MSDDNIAQEKQRGEWRESTSERPRQQLVERPLVIQASSLRTPHKQHRPVSRGQLDLRGSGDAQSSRPRWWCCSIWWYLNGQHCRCRHTATQLPAHTDFICICVRLFKQLEHPMDLQEITGDKYDECKWMQVVHNWQGKKSVTSLCVAAHQLCRAVAIRCYAALSSRFSRYVQIAERKKRARSNLCEVPLLCCLNSLFSNVVTKNYSVNTKCAVTTNSAVRNVKSWRITLLQTCLSVKPKLLRTQAGMPPTGKINNLLKGMLSPEIEMNAVCLKLARWHHSTIVVRSNQGSTIQPL